MFLSHGLRNNTWKKKEMDICDLTSHHSMLCLHPDYSTRGSFRNTQLSHHLPNQLPFVTVIGGCLINHTSSNRAWLLALIFATSLFFFFFLDVWRHLAKQTADQRVWGRDYCSIPRHRGDCVSAFYLLPRTACLLAVLKRFSEVVY